MTVTNDVSMFLAMNGYFSAINSLAERLSDELLLMIETASKKFIDERSEKDL